MADVPDDADERDPRQRFGRRAQLDTFAHRVLVREQFASYRFVDQSHLRRAAGFVALIEPAPAAQRDSHRREVSGCGAPELHVGSLARGRRPSLDPYPASEVRSHQRQARHGRHIAHAGNCAQRVDDLAGNRRALLRGRRRPRLAGPNVGNSFSATNASPTPAIPPASDSTSPSINNCRTNLNPDAPSATRTEISLCRAAVRAKSRFATLAQASNRIRPTAASNNSSVGRSRPAITASSGCAPNSNPRFVSGNCWAKLSPIRCNSPRACSTLTPGFNRPIAFRKRRPRGDGAS